MNAGNLIKIIMAKLILIEQHSGQRRQLSEEIKRLEHEGYVLSGKFEAGVNFANWQSLFEHANARGLFEDKQIIVCESAELLGEFPEKLIDSIEAPDDKNSSSVIIAAFANALKPDEPEDKEDKEDKEEGEDKPKAKAKAKGKNKNLNLFKLDKVKVLKGEAEVPPWKRKDWLLDLAREKNIKLAPDAAALLGEFIDSQEELRAVLYNLGGYAEIKKLKNGVDVNLVRALSFDEGSRALLTFLDGVCQAKYKDVANSLKYLKQDILLPVLTGLCNRLRPAVYIAAFKQNSDKALAAIGQKNLNAYAVKMAREALRNYGDKALKIFLLKAIKLSYDEKGSDATGWPGFEVILWELIMSKR